tara:strand:+ start:1408 stop:2151 length:744 start_codon:yes stop_codon:yes gene_type:complete
MIKDIEYIFKKIFLSEEYLLKKRLKRAIAKNYEKELSIVDHFKDKSKDAIDVGVYRGVYSYKLSKEFNQIHSFEPNPLLYPYLNRYLSKIIPNMTLYNYALSNKNEITNLKIPRRGKSVFKNNFEEIYKLGCATIHEANNFEKFNNYEVECKKLDDVIKDKNISFIKIDVEGHELSVIEGANNIINKYKPTLLVEIEEKHTKKPVLYTINKIKEFGYKVYFFKNNQIKEIVEDNMPNEERNFIFINS